MGVFARENGEWVEADLRARVGSDWTDQYDNGYIRVGSEWVQFQPGPQGALIAPTNLTVVPWDISATGSWVNPAQPVTPTQVQFRIPELTTVWTEFTYPHTTATFPVLSPSTNYQMQVRYIVRTDGEITATGPIATKFFTTLAPTGPGVPAADPGGSGGDSITYFPSPPGGTPGPVGGTDCWWEYMIQEFDVDLYVFNDTSLTAEVDGDIGALTFNFEDEGFACGTTLRWKYREVCNSVPGDWEYGTAWIVICDYDDPCDSVNQTTAFGRAPFTDAIIALPRICYREGETAIEDFITEELTYGKLTAYDLPVYSGASWELQALDDLSPYGEPLVAGHNPALVPLGSSVPSLTSDTSFTIGVLIDEQPSAGSGAPVKLAQIGEVIKIYAYAEGPGVRFSCGLPIEGGGQFDLAGATEFTIDEWHYITVTIDQDGDKILYVDQDMEITDSDVSRAAFGGLTGNIEIYANDRMRVKHVGIWDRALSPEEVARLAPSAYEVLLASFEPSTHYAFMEIVDDGPLGTFNEVLADLEPDVHWPMTTIEDP